jgi:hypothetical protein
MANGKITESIEDLTQELAMEYCKENNVPYTEDIYKDALSIVLGRFEVDKSWKKPWVYEWLDYNK